MGKSSSQKGKEAEDFVVSYLGKKGWKILARNYKGIGGEIDIVALDGKEMVIVEVKSGKADAFSLSSSVNATKRKRIAHTIQEFQYKNRIQHNGIRFEVITVTMPSKIITHFTEEFLDW